LRINFAEGVFIVKDWIPAIKGEIERKITPSETVANFKLREHITTTKQHYLA